MGGYEAKIAFEIPILAKHLISGRIHSDRSGVRTVPRYGVSGLGIELCDYVDHYDEIVSA